MNMFLLLPLALARDMHLFRSSSSVPRLTSFLEMLPKPNVLLTFDKYSTSKSGADMWCFQHFDLETRFAPQQRALFRHHNFQKRSDVDVLYGLAWKFALRGVVRKSLWFGFFKRTARKSACEGHGGSEGLITYEGTRITDPKGTYKLGEAWTCSDQVWAYWTADATTASLGKVMAVGTTTLRFHQLMFFLHDSLIRFR